MMIISKSWEQAYPGAVVGELRLGEVANPEGDSVLDQRKETLEADLRARFSGYDRAGLRDIPVLQAYHAYYKRFDKTYHVQLQLESVVLKGKSIPRVAALVECMFMAELKNLLLTAGHDTDRLIDPVQLGVAQGDEVYMLLNGQEQALKAGDMYIADREAAISSVIYGPDRRTRIRPETKRALFTVYAPPGIGEEAVWEHLRDIEANVRLIAPEVKTEVMEVYLAG